MKGIAVTASRKITSPAVVGVWAWTTWKAPTVDGDARGIAMLGGHDPGRLGVLSEVGGARPDRTVGEVGDAIAG